MNKDFIISIDQGPTSNSNFVHLGWLGIIGFYLWMVQ